MPIVSSGVDRVVELVGIHSGQTGNRGRVILTR